MFFAKLERLFTRSVDNDRTEEEHVTKKSPNYRAIPDNVLQKLTVLIINKDAAKKLGIRVGRTLHVSSILQNSPANGQLKPGDLILSINGTKMNARNQFDEVIAKINDGKFKFEVKRPRPPKELETDSEINKNLPNSYDRLPGYKYFVGNICVYPGANLGIHIMSLESKVYVTNAPQDSLAGEVFNMGDAILAIDGVPVTTVKLCSSHIKDALCQKGWCKALVERPHSGVAKRQAKAALKAEKNLEMDPKLAEDVQTICQEIINLINEEIKKGTKTEVKGILREKKPGKMSSRVLISETSEEAPVGCDPFNPELMQSVDRTEKYEKYEKQSAEKAPEKLPPSSEGGKPETKTPPKSPKNAKRKRKKTKQSREDRSVETCEND